MCGRAAPRALGLALLCACAPLSPAKAGGKASARQCAAGADSCPGSSKQQPPPSPPSPPSASPQLPGAPLVDGGYGVPQHLPLRIEPPFLSFEPWPLCVPAVGTLELINTHATDAFDVHSAAADSEIFHASTLSLTRLEPGGRVPISVVFLPRALGSINGSLLVQTSLGGFFYALRAYGVPSPYGLSPLLAARVPMGAPYSPAIELRNPHDEPLRVQEVYTSENFLHLSLPLTPPPPPTAQVAAAASAPAQGESPLHSGLWLLQPGETKTVISVAFSGSLPGVYRGYVHIKTGFDTLIIPIEIAVTKKGIQRVPEVVPDARPLPPPHTHLSAPSLWASPARTLSMIMVRGAQTLHACICVRTTALPMCETRPRRPPPPHQTPPCPPPCPAHSSPSSSSAHSRGGDLRARLAASRLWIPQLARRDGDAAARPHVDHLAAGRRARGLRAGQPSLVADVDQQDAVPIGQQGRIPYAPHCLSLQWPAPANVHACMHTCACHGHACACKAARPGVCRPSALEGWRRER